jgi:acyl-CoA synthetase (AMP-forming)/AMP-acid ligase II
LRSLGDRLLKLERLVVVAGADSDGTASWPADLETVAFESLFLDGDRPLPEGPRYRDLMAVMYTSGTTGPSKGVMITHAHAYEYALSVIELLEMTGEEVRMSITRPCRCSTSPANGPASTLVASWARPSWCPRSSASAASGTR